MNEIKEKIAMLEGYAEIMEVLEGRIRWYQHEDENGNFVDDDGEYSENRLKALRETVKAVRKLAGI